MSMELVLKSVSVDLPQEIENLEQLKAELAPRLEKYNNLVVTEDSIKAAKEDKANLNKLRKAIEEQRISIKKQYLEPYNVLEAQCKEVVALIDAPIKAIDEQIKAFDEIEKKEKLTKLQTAFYKTEHPSWLQFASICPDKWENKTSKTDKLIEQIEESVKNVNAELEEINSIYAESQLLTAIIDRYKQTLSKAETLSYAVQLEQQLKAEQERKAEEERRKAELEALKVQQEQEKANSSESELNTPIIDSAESNINTLANEQTANNDQNLNDSDDVTMSEPILKGKFTVECTKSQLIALRDFMKSQGIKFEIVK
jgi:DNA repair exonuclease SbcCD ATPase subunit